MKIKVCNMTSPVLDSAPFFSWEYPDDEFSRQKEYRLTVSENGGFSSPVCDMGENTDERINIKPDMALSPCKKYDVRVISRTEDGKEYTGETHFSTGLMGQGMRARWITGHKCQRRREITEAAYLRHDFRTGTGIKSAVLYICGLGYFEARINGKKVGSDFLSTPYTSYDKHVIYRVFDVTDMLCEGENAVGVILGNGFYNCFTLDPWQTATAPWRDVPKLICRMDIEYTNGEKEEIKSGSGWRSLEGPITFNGIRHGEEYDARLEKDGWDMPGYTGESFPCLFVRDPGAVMTCMEAEPVIISAKYKPISRKKVKEGWLYDVGRSLAGITEITFRGKKNEKYKMRYSDLLKEDGSLDLDSLSGFIHNYIFQTETYIKRSDLPEKHHAIFTYEGFRYIEISECENPPEAEDIEVWALCNGFSENTSFETDNDTVNRIFEICRNSTVSSCVNTFASDTIREKSSWTGDTGLSAEQLLINFGAGQFMKKWMTDLRDSQRPGGCIPCIIPSAGWGYNAMNGPDWSQPVFTVPMSVYKMTGNTDILRDNYDALCRYCDYQGRMSDGGILNYGLGDWCAPFEGAALSVNMGSFKCPVTVTDTAYYYSALKAAVEYAKALGKKDGIEKYASLAEKVRKAFRDKFFDKSTYTVYGDCQTSTSVMLYHGLCDEDEKQGLLNKLLSQIKRDGDCLDTGVLGTKAMLEALGQGGMASKALSLLCRDGYPSVKHWLDLGATTLWECWNGGGSHNHHMFSHISAFLIKYVGGISASSPAYRNIEFRPALDSFIGYAKTEIKTPYGKASCSFEKKDGETLIKITVPSSCRGVLFAYGKSYPLSSGNFTLTL